MFVCKKCNSSYDESLGNTDGLCPNCAPSDKNPLAANQQPDWKKPLYDYACLQARRWHTIGFKAAEAYLIRLGDYQDCPDRLENLRKQHRIFYEEKKATVQTGNNLSELKQAVVELEGLGDFEDAAGLVETGKKRIMELEEANRIAEEEAARQLQIRARRSAIIKWSILAGLILIFIGYVLIVPPMHIKKGDALLADGKYEEAIESYKKGQVLWYISKVKDTMLSAKEDMAEHLLSAEDYCGAIEAYEELKTEYISSKLSGSRSDSYTDEIDVTISDIYLMWSDSCAENGDAALAIEKLLLASPEARTEKRYAELMMQQADEAIAAMKAHASPDAEYLRNLGMPLTTLSSQLRFCNAVHAAGYNLMEVYPDGVEVEDVYLGAYQVENIWESDDTGMELVASKFLIFERIEADYYSDLTERSDEIFKERDPSDDSLYTIKLQPGYMYRYPTHVASSWDEAAAIVLVDNIYRNAGTLLHKTTKTYGTATLTTSETEYPFYSAGNILAVYGKDNPLRGAVIVSEWNDPIVCDDEWFNTYKITSVPTYIKNRVGEFDNSSTYDGLTTYLTLAMLFN